MILATHVIQILGNRLPKKNFQVEICTLVNVTLLNTNLPCYNDSGKATSIMSKNIKAGVIMFLCIRFKLNLLSHHKAPGRKV